MYIYCIYVYIILRFDFTNHMLVCIVYCRLARLTGAFKIILSQCCVLLDLIRRISNYMCQILSFAKDQQTFESTQSVYSQDHPKRKKITADMELRNYPKPSVYPYNYQTETAIFLAAKHEKNNYGMQLFNVFKYLLHF